MARTYKIATAAGTFDHFHKGHEAFLEKAFELADTLYIGITSDAFAKAKRFVVNLAPFTQRRKDVEKFLENHGFSQRAKIIELNDIYGSTLDADCPIESIIITEKTRYGAELINKFREQKGLPAFAIEEISFVHAADGGDLSASRIRTGEIDEKGNTL